MKSEYGALLRLGLPVLVSQVAVIVVSFADTMMVGSYGTSELAAAAFVNSFFTIAVVMQIGFAAGLTPLVGALYSRRSHDRAGAMLRAALRVNVAMSLVFTAAMGVCYFLLDRFGQPEELLPLIRPYYLIVLATLLPMALFNCCQQMATGVTDTALPMWVMIGANVLNIAGNWLLIFGHMGCPRLGLVGAGLSTLLARVAACAAMLWMMYRSRRYAAYRAGLRGGDCRGLTLRVWVTSFPVMVQNGIECALWTLGAIVCGWYGAVQLASYQVVNTLGQLGFMTYISFGVAVSVRVANAKGLGDLRSMRRSAAAGLHINLVLGTAASLVFLLAGRHILGLFSPDAAVVAGGVALLLPLVVYQYCDAIQLTYANALRGTSHVSPLLTVALVCYVVLGVPSLFGLAVGMDLRNVGVYWSFNVALLAAAVLLHRAFARTMRRMERSEV